MKKFISIFFASVFSLAAAESPVIQAPPMPQREAVKPDAPAPGKTLVLHDGPTEFTLFVPPNWHAPTNGQISLHIHFHGAVWFAIEEHLRAKISSPLIAATLGEGSSKYRVPFEDKERLKRWVHLTEKSLVEQGAPTNSHVTTLDISSFSAGYGAVREIIQSPEYLSLIRRVVLDDSIYAGLQSTNADAPRVPLPANIEPWLPLVRAAAHGEKTFALSHSEVPTSYANSEECAFALIKAVGATQIDIPAGSNAAASDPQFPLRYQSDLGHFHVWGYGGVDAAAHTTHFRHQADVWMALDAAKNP